MMNPVLLPLERTIWYCAPAYIALHAQAQRAQREQERLEHLKAERERVRNQTKEQASVSGS